MVVQLDEVINQAQATKGALAAQRSTFMEVQSKLKQLGDRFPAIRGILGTLSYLVYWYSLQLPADRVGIW